MKTITEKVISLLRDSVIFIIVVLVYNQNREIDSIKNHTTINKDTKEVHLVVQNNPERRIEKVFFSKQEALGYISEYKDNHDYSYEMVSK
jgi:hypothetical protein